MWNKVCGGLEVRTLMLVMWRVRAGPSGLRLPGLPARRQEARGEVKGRCNGGAKQACK